MTQHSPSHHPQETLNNLTPDIIAIIQKMYKDESAQVIWTLEGMDTWVKKVVIAAIKWAHWAMKDYKKAVSEYEGV